MSRTPWSDMWWTYPYLAIPGFHCLALMHGPTLVEVHRLGECKLRFPSLPAWVPCNRYFDGSWDARMAAAKKWQAYCDAMNTKARELGHA